MHGWRSLQSPLAVFYIVLWASAYVPSTIGARGSPPLWFLVARFAVTSVPTTLVFKDGVLEKRMVGARGKRQILEELADVLS